MHFVTVFARLKCCCINSNVFVWSYKYSRPNYFSWNRRGRKIHEIKYTRKIQVLQYVGWVGSWVMKMDPWTTLCRGPYNTVLSIVEISPLFLQFETNDCHWRKTCACEARLKPRFGKWPAVFTGIRLGRRYSISRLSVIELILTIEALTADDVPK